jgi:lipocalin
MKSIVCVFAILAALFAVSSAVQCDKVPTYPVDPAKYLGVWYEIGASPSRSFSGAE